MPGLLNQDHELPNSITHELGQETNITKTPPAMPGKSISSPAMASVVRFIPPQIDALTSTTTEAARKNPFRLLFQDLCTLISNLPHLLGLIIPFQGSESSWSIWGIRDVVLQSWLSLFEASMLVFAIPAVLFLPGVLLIGVTILCSVAIFLAAWPMHGSRLVFSKMDESTVAMAKQHERERWIFVNGCTTSHAGVQRNIDRISKTFGRAVIGVHNRSYGLIVDLIECLVQRCFAYSTADVRVTYDYVKALLADPTVSKVILIGHSQGGIVISLVLDYLLADLPASSISKLEIYTFGSAASHFNNPRLGLSPRSPRCILHIEHYCNANDPMARWGVLHSTASVLDNRYSGAIFVRERARGHLFNQHYMHALFPLASSFPSPSPSDDAVAHHPGAVPAKSAFWDTVVLVDEKTAIRRESAAVRKMGLGRELGSSLLGVGEGAIGSGNGVGTGEWNGGLMMADLGEGVDGGGGGALGRKAWGKKVCEISRLWMYLDGGQPVDLDG